MTRASAVALAMVALSVAACGEAADSSSGSTTTAAPTSTASAAPSQSAADAERDGVVAELAALPTEMRSRRVASIETPEGAWVLSRPTDAVVDASTQDGCLLGRPEGKQGVENICTSEYGEVLLVDEGGAIERAYPMPSVPPKWIDATDDAVFAGAIGDGALPTSTIARIDRATRVHEVIVFPFEDSPVPPLLPGWRLATSAEQSRLDDVVMVGGGATGTEVTSVIGPVRVDLEAVEAMFR